MIMTQCRLEKYLRVKIRLYFNSMVVRLSYRQLVCHDVVSLFIY